MWGRGLAVVREARGWDEEGGRAEWGDRWSDVEEQEVQVGRCNRLGELYKGKGSGL